MTEKTTVDKLLDVISDLIKTVKTNSDHINILAKRIAELQNKTKDVQYLFNRNTDSHAVAVGHFNFLLFREQSYTKKGFNHTANGTGTMEEKK